MIDQLIAEIPALPGVLALVVVWWTRTMPEPARVAGGTDRLCPSNPDLVAQLQIATLGKVAQLLDLALELADRFLEVQRRPHRHPPRTSLTRSAPSNARKAPSEAVAAPARTV